MTMMTFDLECGMNFKRRLWISLAIFGSLALLVSGYTLIAGYFSVSGYGDWGLVGEELVLWGCVAGMALMGLAGLGLLFSRIRCAAMATLLGATLFVCLTLASLWWSDQVRRDGFARLAREAAPLVAAIEAYQETHGHPPESLDALDFRVPDGHPIRGGKLPQFSYISGYRAIERHHGNPWVLVLETPTGPLRWDRFLYYPLQNYPSLGYGGWLEPIDGWAYLHE